MRGAAIFPSIKSLCKHHADPRDAVPCGFQRQKRHDAAITQLNAS